MGFDINIHLHLPPAITEALSNIARELHTSNERLRTMNQAMTDLQAAVDRERGVVASAITLIQGLADRIAAAGTDPVALRQLTQDLTTQADALAAAVATNPIPPTDGAAPGGDPGAPT